MPRLTSSFEKVLVFAPHSDDDVLGCGGLMRRVVKEGGEVYVIVVALGNTVFHHSGGVIEAETRESEFYAALDSLGVTKGGVMYRDKEQWLDTVPIGEIITKMDDILRKIQPTAVLIPYPSFHQDHKVVFNASFAALRPTVDTHYVQLVAMYEYPFIVWDNSPMEGSRFHVDITEEIDAKVNAMACHVSQIRPAKELISLETVRVWAQYRGLEVGVPFAEAYRALKMVL